MSINKAQEGNLFRKSLSVAVLTGTAGGNDKEIIAAPGAGQKIRVYGAIVTQLGTAACNVEINFATSNRVVLKGLLVNTGIPLSAELFGNFVEGDANEALNLDIADQAADNFSVTVYYTVEDI